MQRVSIFSHGDHHDLAVVLEILRRELERVSIFGHGGQHDLAVVLELLPAVLLGALVYARISGAVFYRGEQHNPAVRCHLRSSSNADCIVQRLSCATLAAAIASTDDSTLRTTVTARPWLHDGDERSRAERDDRAGGCKWYVIAAVSSGRVALSARGSARGGRNRAHHFERGRGRDTRWSGQDTRDARLEWRDSTVRGRAHAEGCHTGTGLRWLSSRASLQRQTGGQHPLRRLEAPWSSRESQSIVALRLMMAGVPTFLAAVQESLTHTLSRVDAATLAVELISRCLLQVHTVSTAAAL